MKFLLPLIIILVLFINSPMVPLNGQPTLRILPLGNSITHGTISGDTRPDADKIGYRKKLHDLLNGAGYSFEYIGHIRSGEAFIANAEHCGIPGTWAWDLSTLISTGSYKTIPVTSGSYLHEYQPDIILLHVGTNDINNNGLNASVGGIRNILDHVRQQEIETGRPMWVIMAKVISFKYNDCGEHAAVAAFNQKVGALAQEKINAGYRIILVDMECDAGIDYTDDMIDILHPNTTGNDKMGTRWFEAIHTHFNHVLNPAPAAPSNLQANVTGNSIQLSWTDNSSNETGFQIERSTNGGKRFILVHTTSPDITGYLDQGLTLNTTYTYRVRSINTLNSSAYSAHSSGTISQSAPSAPSNLNAQAVSSGQINLSWTDNSLNETGFQVERSLQSSSGFVLIHTTAANATGFQDQPLTENTTYYYRVRAINSAGSSAYSNVGHSKTAQSIPLAPGNLQLQVVSLERIDLSWSDLSFNEDGFSIERSVLAESGFAVIFTAGAGVTAYTDKGLQENTRYYYRVRSFNDAGGSTYTPVATSITPKSIPLAPTNLKATTLSTKEIELRWNDASFNETGFQIERLAPGEEEFTLVHTTGPGVTLHVDAGLNDYTTYKYRVRAIHESAESNFSNEAVAITLQSPPGKPGNLRATAIMSNTIAFAWDDLSDNEVAFEIRVKPQGSDNYSTWITLPENSTFSKIDSLQPSTSYSIWVWAIAQSGVSSFSNILSITTLQPDTLPTRVLTANTPTGLAKVFPNPVSTTATVIYMPMQQGEYSIILVDSWGRTRHVGSLKEATNEYKLEWQLDVHSFERGIYILLVDRNKEIVTRQVIIVN